MSWSTVSIDHEIAIKEGKYIWINILNLSNAVVCRLRPCTSLLRQDRVIANVKYFRHVCVCLLVVGWWVASVLTLWVGETGRVCSGESNTTFFMMSLRRQFQMPPKSWLHCTKPYDITSFNFVILVFTAVVTLKCRVVLPCFPYLWTQKSQVANSTALNKHP